MTTDENVRTTQEIAESAPASSTSADIETVSGGRAEVVPSVSRRNLLVWGGIALAILVMTAGTVAALYIRTSVDACIGQIENERRADAHRDQAGASPNAREVQHPTDDEKRARQRTDGDEPHERPCPWPADDADTVIGRASLEYAFLGFLATLLFGTIGVVGIYLTFSLARDEFRRIRS